MSWTFAVARMQIQIITVYFFLEGVLPLPQNGSTNSATLRQRVSAKSFPLRKMSSTYLLRNTAGFSLDSVRLVGRS